MKLTTIFITATLATTSAFAAEKTTLRIGVQTSGTLDWELSVLPESPGVNPTMLISAFAFRAADAIVGALYLPKAE